MKLGPALKELFTSKAYYRGVIQAVLYPPIDVAVNSTDTTMDNMGAEMAKDLVDNLLADDPNPPASGAV